MVTSPYRTFDAAGHTLVLNTLAGIVTSLSVEPCQIVAQELLSESEVYLLVPLIESFPTYAPYALLLSAAGSETLDQAARRVVDALEHHTLDSLMKPVRQALFRLRLKLAPFGLDVRNLGGLGYQLLPIDGKRGGDNDA